MVKPTFNPRILFLPLLGTLLLSSCRIISGKDQITSSSGITMDMTWSTGYSTDLDMYLSDSNGENEDFSNGTGNSENVSLLDADEDDTYQLAVKHHSGSSPSTWTIIISDGSGESHSYSGAVSTGATAENHVLQIVKDGNSYIISEI